MQHFSIYYFINCNCLLNMSNNPAQTENRLKNGQKGNFNGNALKNAVDAFDYSDMNLYHHVQENAVLEILTIIHFAVIDFYNLL